MKRILAILLAAVLLCGAVPLAANADWGDIITGEIIMGHAIEIFPSLSRLAAYGYAHEQATLRPELEAGLLEGQDLDEVFAELDALTAALFDDMENLLFNTSKQDMEQVVAQCDALFAERFTEEFLAVFQAFSDALVQAADQYLRALLTLSGMMGGLEGWSILFLEPKLRNEAFELFDWIGSTNLFEYDQEGTFAELTAYFTETAAYIRTTMDKIDNARPWWAELPPWLYWILKWLCFGFIWML